jgi:hypothetical protein
MTTCVDTLGPGHILCPTDHCDQFQETSAFHRVCNCVDWQGNPIPDCSVKDNLYPVQTGECFNPDTNTWMPGSAQDCAKQGLPWYFATCYCCCSCFAAKTPVADPEGFKALGDYLIGDQVLAASREGDSWSWDARTVHFSSGSPATTYSGPTAGNIMLYIEYGDDQALIATPNQLMALPTGYLKRADQLVPGNDSLAGADGGSVAIRRISTGYYKGAIHHIATTVPNYEEFDGSLDGHLINTNGVVAADYVLQVFQDTPKMKPHIDPSAPVVGTAAYVEQNPDLVVKPYVVGMSDEVVGHEISSSEFVAFGESTTEIPDGATALFSRVQEILLIDPSIPRRGFSDKTNFQQAEYFVKLASAFFPDVTVTIDWESIHPNVFAYEEGGAARVLVGGELLRIGPLYGPAMAIAIGFGVAAATSDGAQVGRALYDGTGSILLEALGTYWMETVLAGQGQFDTLFTALAKLEATSDEPLGGLGAECLAKVIDAAVSGEDVPACAGGSPTDTLELEGAAYDAGTLVAGFSAALDETSATAPKHYAISPAGKVTHVALDPKNAAEVRISVELDKGSYTLSVIDVTAADGSTLDPDARGAQFQVDAN